MSTTPSGVHLTTERMWLRRFTVADAPALLALDRDPLVRRFVEDGTVPSLESAVEDIEYWLATYPDQHTYGFWAAEDRRVAGRFLGWFHLRPHQGSRDDEPELGYRLVSSCWGHGLATEGARALIDDAFASGRASRVVAETMVVHTASWRVMEKAGMHRARTFASDWPVRIDGDEHGDVEYAITKAEWQRRHAEPESGR